MNLNKLELKYRALGREIELLKKKEDKILVPHCIKIEKNIGEWDCLWIQFHRQVLYFERGVRRVNNSTPWDVIQCKLIKCDVQNLKTWDTVFNIGWEPTQEELKDISNYWKIHDDFRVCVEGKDVRVYSLRPDFSRYKVVPC